MSNATSNHLIDRAAAATDLATEQAIGAAQRGVAAVRSGSQQMLDRAHQASDNTVTYIKGEPVKAMLIAAAAGATLMALVGLLTRTRERN
jgi:ElaB/YqjD/DUF883 family membrane-anchored ribosome-binding protein